MDFSQINEVLGLASSAVGITGKATSTVTALRSLFGSEQAPDSAEATELLNALAADLTAANMMNVQLSEALRALSQELQRQDSFEQEKARYELFQTPMGGFAFKLKEDAANGEPIHFVCTVCLNRDKLISYMRGKYSLVCQTERKHFIEFKEIPNSAY